MLRRGALHPRDKSLLLRRPTGPTKSFMFYLWLFLRVREAHALLARVEKVAAAEFHLRRWVALLRAARTLSGIDARSPPQFAAEAADYSSFFMHKRSLAASDVLRGAKRAVNNLRIACSARCPPDEYSKTVPHLYCRYTNRKIKYRIYQFTLKRREHIYI